MMTRSRIARRTTSMVLLLLLTSLLAACGGASAGQSLSEAVQEIAAQGEAAQAAAGDAPGDAVATVSVPSLRVREEPSSDAAVIFGIKEGEEYDVLSLSSDGEWIQLAIPKAPEGAGWVSSNFVNVEGSIAGAAVVDVTPAPVAPSDTTTGTVAAGEAAEAPLPAPTYAPGAPGTATVNTEGVRLRVRAAPDANAEIVGYIYGGENYAVLETAAEGAWVRIEGRSGTDNLDGGWVSTEFLILY